MREIKFRVWYEGPFGDEMSYPDLYWFEEEGIREIPNEDTHYKFMQYTGLKDCKGKEIYEGDILRGYHSIPSEGPIFQVYWDRGGFIVRSSEDGMRYDIGDIEHKKVEIIGNIYENPELLREEDGSQ